VKDGTSYEKVAKMLKVTSRSVQTWTKNFKGSGIEGLKDKGGSGQKPFFPREKEEELKNVILGRQAKKSGGRLTGTDIQKIVNEEFGIGYALRTTYDLLHRINFVCIFSRSKHPKSDQEAQQNFKRDFKKKS